MCRPFCIAPHVPYQVVCPILSQYILPGGGGGGIYLILKVDKLLPENHTEIISGIKSMVFPC